jgi:perosamine synthetase
MRLLYDNRYGQSMGIFRTMGAMKTLAPIFQLSKSELAALSTFLPTNEPQLTGTHIIPVCEPNISTKEKQYVSKAMDSSWLSSAGSFVERFERAFAATVSKTKFAYAVNSGTSALHLSLAALGIGPGDEVILPTFTMIASANAVLYCGATPIFVDADPVSWNMDVAKIEEKITKKTKAIIAVHIYGAPVAMNEVLHLARKHNIWVVEDAAESHGAIYKGRAVGSIGDVAGFSLYANKVITTGEGGIVVTNNPHIAERLRLLHNHAFTERRHFWHSMVGYGYRMTNLQAAVGVAQVERFEKLLALKRRNAALYLKLLKNIRGITLPVETPETTHAYWMLGILVDAKQFGMNKDQLRLYLAQKGIETRSFFVPMHVQPPYYATYGKYHFPVAEQLCRDGLYLPSSTLLTKRQITYIATTIHQASVHV